MGCLAAVGCVRCRGDVASLWVSQGNWNRAHALCTSATREAPAHFPLRLMLIQCLIGKRDYDTACVGVAGCRSVCGPRGRPLTCILCCAAMR